MKLSRPALLVWLVITFGLVLLYHLGRSLWYPALVKVTGDRTVADVVTTLDPVMRERIPELDHLTDGQPLALLALKEERTIELWKKGRSGWAHLRNYPFTGFSGGPGPKLREGDRQIPEGVYRVEYLNPNSDYHLSIKLDYPNAFDRAKAAADQRTNLGGDIFIHGMSATIGCIPVGNENIEELFYLVAKNGASNTTVIIAPYDMRRKSKPSGAAPWEGELHASIKKALRELTASTP